MTGNEQRNERDTAWYSLVDEATGRVIGEIRPSGEVRSDDPEVARRVADAFRRELFTRNGEVIEELGVCYADVVSVRPGSPDHAGLVFRNLGLLTGYLPAER